MDKIKFKSDQIIKFETEANVNDMTLIKAIQNVITFCNQTGVENAELKHDDYTFKLSGNSDPEFEVGYYKNWKTNE